MERRGADIPDRVKAEGKREAKDGQEIGIPLMSGPSLLMWTPLSTAANGMGRSVRRRRTADELKSYRAAARKVFGRKHRRVLSQRRKGVDMDHSTSYVEWHNLTIRMSNKRYARKPNAFSKMLSRHINMMDLWVVHYNFCRINSSIGMTPAMAAGLDDTPRDCAWIIGLIGLSTEAPKKPGPKVGTKYRPRKK